MVFGMLIATQLNALPIINYQMSFSLPLYPATIMCAFIFCFPQSPRFVLTKYARMHQSEEGEKKARAALLLLRGNEAAADFELNELREHLKEEEERPKGRWITLVRDPSIRKRVIIANGLQWMQQFTGINALLSYGPTMFQQAEMPLDPQYCQVIITVFNIIATIVMMFLIDKLGRRTLLLGGAAGMFVCMAASSRISYLIETHQEIDNLGIMLLLCLCGYIASFGIGWGGCPWVYPSEIFPMDVKEKAMSTSVGSQWLANFVIAFIVPLQVDYFRLWGTFLFYSFCLAANFAVVYLFVPETAGRELEEMDELFGPRVPLLHSDDESESESGSEDEEFCKE
jgi:sugar porter (SP) family MFS transporter